MTTTPWIKATASGANSQCVEMRHNDDTVEIRDSKHPTGPTLRLPPQTWATWLNAAKNGELDHLAD